MEFVFDLVIPNPLHKRQSPQFFKAHATQPGHVGVIWNVAKQFNIPAAEFILPSGHKPVSELNDEQAGDRLGGLLRSPEYEFTIGRRRGDLLVAKTDLLVLSLRREHEAQAESKENPGSR